MKGNFDLKILTNIDIIQKKYADQSWQNTGLIFKERQ